MAQITNSIIGRLTVRRREHVPLPSFLVIELAETVGAGVRGYLSLTLNEARELRDDLSKHIEIIEAREDP